MQNAAIVRAVSALLLAALAACGDGRNYNATVVEQVASETPASSTSPASSSSKGASPGSSAASPSGTQRSSSGGGGAQPADAASAAATQASSGQQSSTADDGAEVDGGAPSSEGQASADGDAPVAPVGSPADERAALEEAVRELSLPTPPEIVVVAGEEPYKKLAQESRFREFRSMSARFVQISKELLPYGRKLADGTATDADRAAHLRLERAADKAFRPLNRYMWNDRWTEADRAAMGWILYGWQAEQK